jgi:hypothetical protein
MKADTSETVEEITKALKLSSLSLYFSKAILNPSNDKLETSETAEITTVARPTSSE